MQIQPVLKFKAPNYPKLEDFEDNPTFIVKNTPDRWKRNKIVWAALVSLAVNNQSCDKFSNKHTRLEIIQIHKRGAKIETSVKEVKGDSSFIAPIFQHGNGIGTYGCEVIMPPVFINEQEAKQLILNELNKENLIFDSVTQPPQRIVIKADKKRWDKVGENYNERDTTEYNKLIFDGYNKDLNFAFYFLSNKGYIDFTDYKVEHSSVSRENYKETAEKVRNEIKKTKDLNAVIFYEPLPYPNYKKNREWPSFKQWRIEGRKVAIDSLKAQVSDFVKWLKTEKIPVK